MKETELTRQPFLPFIALQYGKNAKSIPERFPGVDKLPKYCKITECKHDYDWNYSHKIITYQRIDTGKTKLSEV